MDILQRNNFLKTGKISPQTLILPRISGKKTYPQDSVRIYSIHPSLMSIQVSPKLYISYFSLVELARLRRNGFSFRQQYGAFLGRFKMLCPHTWPNWHGPAVEVSSSSVRLKVKYFPLCRESHTYSEDCLSVQKNMHLGDLRSL